MSCVTCAAERKGASGKPSALDKMKSHLQGGRFRMLNERLYTSNGDDAFQLMQVGPPLVSVSVSAYKAQRFQRPERQPTGA